MSLGKHFSSLIVPFLAGFPSFTFPAERRGSEKSLFLRHCAFLLPSPSHPFFSGSNALVDGEVKSVI